MPQIPVFPMKLLYGGPAAMHTIKAGTLRNGRFLVLAWVNQGWQKLHEEALPIVNGCVSQEEYERSVSEAIAMCGHHARLAAPCLKVRRDDL